MLCDVAFFLNKVGYRRGLHPYMHTPGCQIPLGVDPVRAGS